METLRQVFPSAAGPSAARLWDSVGPFGPCGRRRGGDQPDMALCAYNCRFPARSPPPSASGRRRLTSAQFPPTPRKPRGPAPGCGGGSESTAEYKEHSTGFAQGQVGLPWWGRAGGGREERPRQSPADHCPATEGARGGAPAARAGDLDAYRGRLPGDTGGGRAERAVATVLDGVGGVGVGVPRRRREACVRPLANFWSPDRSFAFGIFGLSGWDSGKGRAAAAGSRVAL